MERRNKDIKLLYEISCGATNFPRMRNRIMFCINKEAPILATRKELTGTLVKKEVLIRRPKINQISN